MSETLNIQPALDCMKLERPENVLYCPKSEETQKQNPQKEGGVEHQRMQPECLGSYLEQLW
jgi:hypothetical protein